MVEFEFTGTGIRVFSPTVPIPDSYELYVDGERVSERAGSSSTSDSQVLLGSITGLEMAPHTVTLANSGMAGDDLYFDHVEVESILTNGSPSLSTATFDDTVSEIQWGPGWVSASGQSAFYNGTIHYTDQPDAKMSFSFEGDAITIYGTVGAEMGNYVVTLDGQFHTFDGGSNGSVRIPHDKTVLCLISGLGDGRHELTITANPSSLGEPRVFNVDSISILSDGSSGGAVLLPPGSSGTGTPSTLRPLVSTGPSYTSVISDRMFPGSTPLSASVSFTPSPPSMPSLFTSPTALPPAQPDSSQTNPAWRTASGDFNVLTNNGVITSAILSATIAVIGLIFLALFMWKRKNLDPPSYMDVERSKKPDIKGPMVEPGEKSPEWPIQPTDDVPPSSAGKEIPFTDFAPYAQYRESLAERTRGHSRSGSNASSTSANDSTCNSYLGVLQKRALVTHSVLSTDSNYQDSVSDYSLQDPGDTVPLHGSTLSVYSDDDQYSQTSERIYINNVRMPPQFSTPMRPPSVAMPSLPGRMPPPRPLRVGGSIALPF